MQHNKLWSALAALVIATWAAPVWSHPGHGTTEPTSVAHAAEPVHLLPVVLLAVVLLAVVIALGSFFLVQRLQQVRERK